MSGTTARVGNDVIFATSATLGGHCEIGDFVFIGGLSAVHQVHADRAAGDGRRRLRRARRRHSVRPRQRQYAGLEGLNIIGMKRRKFTRERLARVRSFYQKLFHGPAFSPSGWTRCSRSPARIQRLRKSSASSAMASIARCAFRPAAATRIDDGLPQP
jgi:hypothetical protein